MMLCCCCSAVRQRQSFFSPVTHQLSELVLLTHLRGVRAGRTCHLGSLRGRLWTWEIWAGMRTAAGPATRCLSGRKQRARQPITAPKRHCCVGNTKSSRSRPKSDINRPWLLLSKAYAPGQPCRNCAVCNTASATEFVLSMVTVRPIRVDPIAGKSLKSEFWPYPSRVFIPFQRATTRRRKGDE